MIIVQAFLLFYVVVKIFYNKKLRKNSKLNKILSGDTNIVNLSRERRKCLSGFFFFEKEMLRIKFKL